MPNRNDVQLICLKIPTYSRLRARGIKGDSFDILVKNLLDMADVIERNSDVRVNGNLNNPVDAKPFESQGVKQEE